VGLTPRGNAGATCSGCQAAVYRLAERDVIDILCLAKLVVLCGDPCKRVIRPCMTQAPLQHCWQHRQACGGCQHQQAACPPVQALPQGLQLGKLCH
jgi:hypothetical protein